MQVVIVVFGARNSDFFSYEKEDGFKRLRYVSMVLKPKHLFEIISSVKIKIDYY